MPLPPIGLRWSWRGPLHAVLRRSVRFFAKLRVMAIHKENQVGNFHFLVPCACVAHQGNQRVIDDMHIAVDLECWLVDHFLNSRLMRSISASIMTISSTTPPTGLA